MEPQLNSKNNENVTVIKIFFAKILKLIKNSETCSKKSKIFFSFRKLRFFSYNS